MNKLNEFRRWIFSKNRTQVLQVTECDDPIRGLNSLAFEPLSVRLGPVRIQVLDVDTYSGG